MKHRIIGVKNVLRLQAAGDALINRAMGLPGIGLIWGPTGYGKTTAATWFINQCNGVFVRARALWSPKVMLSTIARELDLEVHGRNNGEIVDMIVARLAETGRPLFIDEADYVLERKLLTDTLRDIHDLSTVPVILIGMHGIEKRIRGNEQFTGRIAQWVEFRGADTEDARVLADGLCEIEIAQDILDDLFRQACPKRSPENGAEVRRLVVGLSNIEYYGRLCGLSRMTLSDWPDDRDYFLGRPVAQDSKKRRARKVTPLRGGR